MKTFKDNCDRNWTLSLNVDVLMRVKDLEEIDLMALEEGTPPLISRLLGRDVVLQCNVLFAVLKPDAEALSPPVTATDFARGMGGAGLANAVKALRDELTDFFQTLGLTDLCQVMASYQQLQEAEKATKIKVSQRAAQTESARLAGIDIDALIEKARALILAAQNPTSGTPSGSSPESSGSIPVNSLSDS